jgi:hypothetical protein
MLSPSPLRGDMPGLGFPVQGLAMACRGHGGCAPCGVVHVALLIHRRLGVAPISHLLACHTSRDKAKRAMLSSLPLPASVSGCGLAMAEPWPWRAHSAPWCFPAFPSFRHSALWRLARVGACTCAREKGIAEGPALAVPGAGAPCGPACFEAASRRGHRGNDNSPWGRGG